MRTCSNRHVNVNYAKCQSQIHVITSKPRVCEYRIHCRTFDREPSRLPVKRFYRLLNKSRKTRRINISLDGQNVLVCPTLHERRLDR